MSYDVAIEAIKKILMFRLNFSLFLLCYTESKEKAEESAGNQSLYGGIECGYF